MGGKLLLGAFVSVWEPKVELDPLCCLGALVITCRGAAWGGDALQDGNCWPGSGVGQKPLRNVCAWGLEQVWLMCAEEGRGMSPFFPRIALARAGNPGDTPACGTPEILNALGDAQTS